MILKHALYFTTDSTRREDQSIPLGLPFERFVVFRPILYNVSFSQICKWPLLPHSLLLCAVLWSKPYLSASLIMDLNPTYLKNKLSGHFLGQTTEVIFITHIEIFYMIDVYSSGNT